MPPEPQIITVLGERVSLEPTTFPSSEKFLVFFDDKYKYPDISDSEALLLKKLLVTLFSEDSKPNPPCSDKEKGILIKSLRYRFSILRNELIAERKSQSDSLRLRQILDQFERLKNYIDFAETVKECKEMDESILAESLGDLTEDQILQLLRQFVFFILQGQHPLEEFRGRDPNPKGFVARLDRNPLPNFQEFLDKYRDKKHPVPQSIEHVLESTKIDLDAMKKGVDMALSEKIAKIMTLLKGVIPASDPFWKSPLWDAETPDIVGIVDELLSFVKGLMEDLDSCQDEIDRIQRDIHSLHEAKDMNSESEKILESQIAILEEEVTRLQSEVLGQEEKAALEAETQAKLQSLQKELQTKQADTNRLTDELRKKEVDLRTQHELVAEKEAELTRLQGSQEELERLRQMNASLEEQLRVAQQKTVECQEAQSRVKALEGEVQTKEEELTQLRQHAGKLTLDIDAHLQDKIRLQAQIDGTEEVLGFYNELKDNIEEFIRALNANAANLLTILESIQRQRSELNKKDDPILVKLLAVKEAIQASNGEDPSLSSQVADILKDVQAEVNELEAQKKAVEGQVAEKEVEIERAQRQMEEGNRLLSQVRKGREDLQNKGITFETDKDTLDAAFKAVEAEKELKEKRLELERQMGILNAQNQTLQADMEALTVKLADEVKAVTERLRVEEEKSLSLENQLADSQQDMTRAIEEERTQTAQKLATLEETRLRDCEERLNALREEEGKKREALVSAQGGEKGELESRIADLLRQITTVEGERDAAKQEVTVFTDRLQQLETDSDKQKQDSQIKITELEEQLKKAATVTEDVEDLKSQIIADSTEKSKIFDLVSQLSAWILSGATIPQPTINKELSTKYGFNRIINSFLSYLPPEPVGSLSESSVDPMGVAMSRCQLVFFMTYVYARHFPKKADGDSSYQSEIMSFLRELQTGMYRVLDVGIPGKLESVGAGGIPVQLKSKYMMNLLLPLLKQMEVVHESGKKGADFLKFNLLDSDQVTILHRLHRLILDKLIVPKNRDFYKTLNNYVTRKSGNVDGDIHELYLRFVRESNNNLEFPVIMYVKEDAPSISKGIFASEKDFSKYLSSPTQLSEPLLDKSLVSKPIFSFNIVFYLFLFFVKDYLSSIEGELDKAGCPLPQALKPL